MYTSINQSSNMVNPFSDSLLHTPYSVPHIEYPLPQLGNIHEITQPCAIDAGLQIIKRLERWQLQNVARSVLYESPLELFDGEDRWKEKEGYEHRVCKCHRTNIQSNVDLMRSKEGRVHYKGLMICGSVWACPVCASKISERRRLELVEAVNRAKALGLRVYLVTSTAPHHQGDGLKLLLERFTNARRLFRNRKEFKKWAKEIGLKGYLRALETTHGFNSWHNHTHELFFCDGSKVPDARDILLAWQKACIDAGLEMPNEHGLVIDMGDKAAKYAAKWGIEDELTKAHIKKGREGRLTPFDLLREVRDNRCVESTKLFREYVNEFKGRKQLAWSKGLRSLLGCNVELSDEEVAAQIEEGSILLGSLTNQQWKVVLGADKRGELLEVAKREGWHGVLKFIEKIY